MTAHEFKKGDRVVAAVYLPGSEAHVSVGDVGTVTDVHGSPLWPGTLYVRFDKAPKPFPAAEGDAWTVYPSEIKKEEAR